MNRAAAIIGIDPGSSKAGYALVEDSGNVLRAGVESIDRLEGCIAQLLVDWPVHAIALGHGTNARPLKARLERFGLPIHWVDEYETSRHARELYFHEHPPRGWRRLIPRGLQTPLRPIDDYAAILIARRFLARGAEAGPPS